VALGSVSVFSGRARDHRRVLSRSEALGEGAWGDRSGCFGVLAGWVGAEVAVAEAVAVALEGGRLGVVDEAVDHRDGDGVVAEDLPPGREWLVGGDDQALAFVAARDEHEHEVRGLGIEWDVANLVADQQRDPFEAPELVVEATLALGVGQERDPFGCGSE